MIDSQQDYERFLKFNSDDDLFLHIIFTDSKSHSVVSKISIVFVQNLNNGELYIFPIDHQDSNRVIELKTLIDDINKFTGRLFVLDKKSFIQQFPIQRVLDINIGLHLLDKDIINLIDYETDAHKFINQTCASYNLINKIIPLVKHKELVQNVYRTILKSIKYDIYNESYYQKINNYVIKSLSEVESNGLFVDIERFHTHFDSKVDNGFVYSQYNLHTSTGRPSNRFGGVNYAALNKEDGSRRCFISRFLKDGVMVLIDYSAFHPRIICELTNFKLSQEVNFYKYISQLFFKKNNVDSQDIEDAKSLTFKQLYGGVEEQYGHIQFFYNLKGYINDNWNFFKENGYALTPFFGRKILTSQIQDPNPNKLFNYILQAAETEIAVPIIGEINNLLSCKNSKSVLYTYDSILLDVHISDLEFIKTEVIEVMKSNNRFPVKCYTGKSYAELKQMEL